MDVLTYDFKGNLSEKETALFFHNLELSCVALNWKMKNKKNTDDGEIDGVFCDTINQLYIIYDDSIKKRIDKIKFQNF